MIRCVELQHQFQAQLTINDVEIGEFVIPEIVGWDQVDVRHRFHRRMIAENVHNQSEIASLG
ncbi:MAG: hypothetical protein FWE95_02540 [Planctomycetaceae bacterium]|nr:hypothetical protein [Planctomycetaceae bacterium]